MALDKALVTRVFIRDGWKCRDRNCNDRNGLHPHHVIFKSHGGPDEMNNLLTLCWQCHEAVHRSLLRVEVVTVLENDLVVRFTRLKGWRPT